METNTFNVILLRIIFLFLIVQCITSCRTSLYRNTHTNLGKQYEQSQVEVEGCEVQVYTNKKTAEKLNGAYRLKHKYSRSVTYASFQEGKYSWRGLDRYIWKTDNRPVLGLNVLSSWAIIV